MGIQGYFRLAMISYAVFMLGLVYSLFLIPNGIIDGNSHGIIMETLKEDCSFMVIAGLVLFAYCILAMGFVSERNRHR